MIAVVHLVWGPLGPDPLREFLTAYRDHPPGVEHELCMLFNNVGARERPALEAELAGVPHRLVELAAPVQDLRAYRQAAERIEHERVLFLNSYSRPLVDGWLSKLSAALDLPGCGLVGATGSWGSFHSAALNSLLLPNPYRRAAQVSRAASLREDAVMRAELDARRGGSSSDAAGAAGAPGESAAAAGHVGSARLLARRVASTLKTLPPIPGQLLRYEGFPAHHLRSNCFMLSRELFLSLRMGPINGKRDAFYVESGRGSITRQVQARGLRTLVVDRDGTTYDQAQWPDSLTFWQGDQERLLMADNQTDVYTNGSPTRRRMLSEFAWASLARPG